MKKLDKTSPSISVNHFYALAETRAADAPGDVVVDIDVAAETVHTTTPFTGAHLVHPLGTSEQSTPVPAGADDAENIWRTGSFS